MDDEPNVRLMYRSALDNSAYQLYEASSSEEALKQCEARKHDIAILDLRMPGGMNGLELLHEMVERKIKTPVVIITAHGDRPNAAEAMKLGAIDFLNKPVLPVELREIVNDILIRHGPEGSKGKPHDCDYYLGCARRAINLRDFAAAKRDLVKALDLDPRSPQATNLCRVMLEMREEHEQSTRSGEL